MAKSKKVTEGLQSTVSSPTKEEDPVDNYQVQDHLRTLTDAHKIINDPEKMAKVHKLAGRHVKALAGIKNLPQPSKIKSIDDVKAFAQKKYGAPSSKGSHSLDALKDTDTDGE